MATERTDQLKLPQTLQKTCIEN